MDFNKLDLPKIDKTVIYKGRVVQADADFYCYFVANLETSVASNVQHLLKILETNRKMSGAEHLNAHLTLGSKGGRHEMATVKAYQQDRKDSDIKTRVREIRSEMANWAGSDTITVIANLITEADDSISQYHAEYNASGQGLSIIDSGDKDLNMNQGVHRDSNTKKLIKVEGYGKTEYKEVGNTKPKLIGYGDSWFWHQMLMGDRADDIPGLEKLSGELMNEYVPTKNFNPNRKSAACGEKKAVAVLLGVNSSSVAAKRVLNCYREYYGDSCTERFIEQAFLLWMRRDGNVWDCIQFFRENGLDIMPSEDQIERVNRWATLMTAIHGEGCVKVEL